MNLFEIIAYVAALALAASKLLVTAKPYWSKLPAVVATALPSVVMVLPAVAEALGKLQSTTDLKLVAMSVVALLLPGAVNKAAVDEAK